MSENLGDDLDRHPIPKKPGRHGVPEPMRIKVDRGPAAQPEHQVVGGGVGHRTTARLAPQIHEDVVRIKITVLLMQVIGVEADEFGADRDRPRRRGLGAGSVVVDARPDCHLPLSGREVFVPETKRLTNANAFSGGL